VHDAGTLDSANAGQILDMREDSIDERAVPIAGGGMDDEADRLVDDEEILVLVNDVERNRRRLGLRLGGCRRRHAHDDGLAALEFHGRLNQRALAGLDAPLGDQPLEARARQIRDQARQRLVEPLAGELRRDRHGADRGSHGLLVAGPGGARSRPPSRVLI